MKSLMHKTLTRCAVALAVVAATASAALART